MNNSSVEKFINDLLCLFPVMRIAMWPKCRWRVRNGVEDVFDENLRDVVFRSVEKVREMRKKRRNLSSLSFIFEFFDKFGKI